MPRLDLSARPCWVGTIWVHCGTWSWESNLRHQRSSPNVQYTTFIRLPLALVLDHGLRQTPWRGPKTSKETGRRLNEGLAA